MNLDINSKCVKLEKDLVDVVNNAGLPIGVIVYILRTLLLTAEKQLNIACLQSEKKSEEQSVEVLEENKDVIE